MHLSKTGQSLGLVFRTLCRYPEGGSQPASSTADGGCRMSDRRRIDVSQRTSENFCSRVVDDKRLRYISMYVNVGYVVFSAKYLTVYGQVLGK